MRYSGFSGDHMGLPSATNPRHPSVQFEANPGSTHIHANGGKSDFPISRLINDNSCAGTAPSGVQRNGPSTKLIQQRSGWRSREPCGRGRKHAGPRRSAHGSPRRAGPIFDRRSAGRAVCPTFEREVAVGAERPLASRCACVPLQSRLSAIRMRVGGGHRAEGIVAHQGLLDTLEAVVMLPPPAAINAPKRGT